MYLDSAYIAKYYVNESDSPAVRALIAKADSLESSAWALAEVNCVFHRHYREGSISEQQCLLLSDKFREHVNAGVWNLIPVSEALLMRAALRVASAPAGIFLRAGDAIHLTTAQDMCAPEIWTNDRHMLAAAVYFGLNGRSVSRPS